MQQETIVKPLEPTPIGSAAYPPFISPVAMRKLSSGLVMEITNENTLTIERSDFRLKSPLPVGTKIRCYAQLSSVRIFDAAAYDKYLAEKRWYRACIEKQQLVAAQQAAEQKAKAIADFWASYNIPFQFTLEHSGLSESSAGNGTKRNSVLHICLSEKYKEGRTSRNAGEFLCSPSESKSGGNWSDTLGDGAAKTSEAVVECKACLKKLEKYRHE